MTARTLVLMALMLALLAAPARAADIVVTVEHDAGNGSCLDAECTLRDAVTEAVSTDRVILPGGIYELDQGSLALNGETIVGTGARSTVIVGDESDRVILADEGVNHISGVTIQGGDSQDAPSTGIGAGVLVRPGRA